VRAATPGQLVRMMMEDAGVSQADVARATGLSKQAISRALRQSVSLPLLDRIGAGLGYYVTFEAFPEWETPDGSWSSYE